MDLVYINFSRMTFMFCAANFIEIKLHISTREHSIYLIKDHLQHENTSAILRKWKSLFESNVHYFLSKSTS